MARERSLFAVGSTDNDIRVWELTGRSVNSPTGAFEVCDTE